MADAPYNPLDKISLAKSIEAEIVTRNAYPLSSRDKIKGSGVYLLYYRGDFHLYEKIALANRKALVRPIYVGKAIPKGGRKGGMSSTPPGEGNALHSRLKRHAESIHAAVNLNLNDFCFRYIVLDDIWIPLGENILIENFRPLWNQVVQGFGINDPGAGRLNQKRSAWDILHPGREYAERLEGGGPDLQAIEKQVKAYFSKDFI